MFNQCTIPRNQCVNCMGPIIKGRVHTSVIANLPNISFTLSRLRDNTYINI